MNSLLQNMGIPSYLKLVQIIKEILSFYYGIKNVLGNLILLDTVWYDPCPFVAM